MRRGGTITFVSEDSHGGHLPGFRRIVARYNDGFLSGLYKVDCMPLYGSHGARLWSGFPV